MVKRGLREKINPIDDACEMRLNTCNHKYEYIATERIPTDDYKYGERVYKEEIIVYCPLCHIHARMSRQEWENWHSIGSAMNRFLKDKETPLCTFTDKKLEFTAENASFNIDWFTQYFNMDTKDIDLLDRTLQKGSLMGESNGTI